MYQEFQSSTFSWQLFFGSASLLIAFTLYIIYKVVVLPLFRLHYYRKQGIPCIYFPLIGDVKERILSLKNHGDAVYQIRKKPRTNPQRMKCSNIGSSIYLTLYDPALIKEFYQNVDNYIKDPIFLELYAKLLGKGLLTSEGTQWKTQRKILSNCFHFEFLKSIVPGVQRTAHQNLHLDGSTSPKDVNILDVFQKITGEVVGKLFFGEQLNQYEIDGEQLTVFLTKLICDIGILSLSVEKQILGSWLIEKGIFSKHKNIFDRIASLRNVCRQIIEERKKQYLVQKHILVTEDMLDLLLEYSGEGGKMTDEEIVDQFVTFFLAGMDTTGHLVLMAVYCLYRHPEHQQKLLEEIKIQYKEDVTIEDLNNLEYTTAFLKETLRTMNPIPGNFPRKALRDHKIQDIYVRKGDSIMLNYFYNNYDPKYFESVESFDPMRWMDKNKNIQSYAFTPFSAGPRNCIGQHLALIEARIILAEFLKMYDFTVQKDAEIKFDFKFLYEPVDPILLNLNRKETVIC